MRTTKPAINRLVTLFNYPWWHNTRSTSHALSCRALQHPHLITMWKLSSRGRRGSAPPPHLKTRHLPRLMLRVKSKMATAILRPIQTCLYWVNNNSYFLIGRKHRSLKYDFCDIKGYIIYNRYTKYFVSFFFHTPLIPWRASKTAHLFGS